MDLTHVLRRQRTCFYVATCGVMIHSHSEYVYNVMGKEQKNVKENRQNSFYETAQEAIRSFESWKHIFYENINTG